MKTIYNFFMMATAIVAMSACSGGDSSNVDKTFYVRGNCGMCEKRIETTVKGVAGVVSADYDVSKEILFVTFDSTATDELTIHEALANVGHETSHVAMNQAAHDELPECCKKEAGKH